MSETNETLDLSRMSDEEFDKVLQRAEAIGEQHARNAAEWWEQDAIGGRASRVTADGVRRTLRALENGMVDLQVPDLSGQWADDMTPDDLLDYLGVEDPTGDCIDDVCRAYEEGAGRMAEYCADACRQWLADAGEQEVLS